MKNIYLLEENYDDFLLDSEFLDSGSESRVLSVQSYVAKLLIPEFCDKKIERKIDEINKLNIGHLITAPLGKIYLDYRFIGYYMENAGINLREYLAKYDFNLSIENKIKLLNDVKKVLNELHEYNVVHGDLQARNILIDSNNIIKIGDINNIGFNKKYKACYFNALTKDLFEIYGPIQDVDIIAFNYFSYLLLNYKGNLLEDFIRCGADSIRFFNYNKNENIAFDNTICDEQMELITNIKRKNKKLYKAKYLIDYLK